MAIATINPATGQTLRTFEPFPPQRVNECLGKAAAAARSHRRTSFADRARWMVRAAEILEGEKQKLGQLMKPRSAGPRAGTTRRTRSDSSPMSR